MRARESGASLIELLVIASLVAVVVGVVFVVSLPALAREGARAASYDVVTFLQLARVESVTRNRDCRFVATRDEPSIQIWDGEGTSDRSDDTLLHERRLPSAVAWVSPDGSAAMNLTALDGGATHEAVFASDGTVRSGAGSLALGGAESFVRVSIFDAGGFRHERWSGSTWRRQ